MIVFGGETAGGPIASTWSYESIGIGQASTTGTPVLMPDGLPWIGETFCVNALGLPQPIASVLFTIGFSDATYSGGALPLSLGTFGAPGCSLLVSPDATMFRTAFLGQVTHGTALPNDPTLVGLMLFQQAFVLDLAANQLGLISSNGVRMAIGAR